MLKVYGEVVWERKFALMLMKSAIFAAACIRVTGCGPILTYLFNIK